MLKLWRPSFFLLFFIGFFMFWLLLNKAHFKMILYYIVISSLPTFYFISASNEYANQLTTKKNLNDIFSQVRFSKKKVTICLCIHLFLWPLKISIGWDGKSTVINECKMSCVTLYERYEHIIRRTVKRFVQFGKICQERRKFSSLLQWWIHAQNQANWCVLAGNSRKLAVQTLQYRIMASSTYSHHTS